LEARRFAALSPSRTLADLKVGSFLRSAQEKEGHSGWSWLFPDRLGNQERDLSLSTNAIIRRLKSGNLLALRILPISAKSTAIECSIYAHGMTNQGQTPIEVESAKRDIQIAVEDLELQQRAIFSGANEALDGKN
jgi:hypothetical protein